MYCHGDPVNHADPTGLFTQRFGYLAHAAISAVYHHDHPRDAVKYGGWTKLGGPGYKAFRLMPDVFNMTRKTWLEIKPLTPSGIAGATAQFAVYSGALLSFGYAPDTTWKPSTHHAVAGARPIVFFNAGGLVFYTDMVDLLKELAVLTSIAAVRAFMATQVARPIAQSVITILGSHIPGLIGASLGFDDARLQGHLGIASLCAGMGLV